jgi:CRP-like cAMP-binding protein
MEKYWAIAKWSIALGSLSASDHDFIRSRLRSRSYRPRQLIFSEGEPSSTLVILKKGRIRLFLSAADGDEFTTHLLRPDALLGLAGVILQRPRIVSAESVEAVEIASMPVGEFHACMAHIPQLSRNVMQLLALLAAENIKRSAPLVLDSASVRLGRLLVFMAHRRDNPSQSSVAGLTHEDLAKMLGVSRTWVSLKLNEFELRGWIAKQRGRIDIIDSAALVCNVL